MANIRIDLLSSITNGQAVTFKSPVDCSDITGLIVYYPNNGKQVSTVFEFTDAHGNDVAGFSLFANDVLVKVILDTESNKAFVQNADTNAYLESKFNSKAPMYDYGEEDLSAGVTALETGKLYFVYE